MHLKLGFEEDSNRVKSSRIKKIMSKGKKPVILKVFHTDDETEAYEHEESLIAKYGVFGDGILTNLTPSCRPPSRKGAIISQEQRDIVGKAARKRLLGKTYEELYGDRAEEVKKKIGAATRRRAKDIKTETREKLSKSNVRSYVEIYGSVEEAERHKKIRSEARKGKKRTPEQRARMAELNRKTREKFGNDKSKTWNGVRYNTTKEAIKASGLSSGRFYKFLHSTQTN
jgi:hypothetical protein